MNFDVPNLYRHFQLAMVSDRFIMFQVAHSRLFLPSNLSQHVLADWSHLVGRAFLSCAAPPRRSYCLEVSSLGSVLELMAEEGRGWPTGGIWTQIPPGKLPPCLPHVLLSLFKLEGAL